MPTSERAGRVSANWRRAESWVHRQRELKAADPGHRVIIDVGMESVRGIHPDEVLRKIHGPGVLGSLDAMKRADLAGVWRELQTQQALPIGGAGGLGIVEETLNWAGARYAESENIGLVSITPLPTTRRRQSFAEDQRQVIDTYTVDPKDSPEYLPLGEATSARLYGNEEPIQAWLFDGFKTETSSTLAFRLVKPGTTDILYPGHESQLVFDQMQVLGQGGFNLAQKLGLIGVENPVADVVIGHDSQTALFKFNIFLWFYQKYGDKEAALRATRKLCIETVHAPQMGTVVRTTGNMVREHYGEEHEALYGEFGMDNGRKTNALFAELRMSGARGVVSPLHLMVTTAEEVARERGFAADPAKLLPDGLHAKDLTLHPDTLDVESWLGMGTQFVLDKYVPGWRENPQMLGEQELLDRLSTDMSFRADLSEAFGVQDHQYFGLLNEHFPRQFGVQIPDNAIVFGSLRRATTYKINLTTAFLRQHETIERIAQNLGRPIFWLFGGLAHNEDSPSITALSELLTLMQEINSRGGMFTSDFLIGHDYDKARWMFAGLARRGAWIGATNPLDQRSQGTEAFGPSYLKAVMNGMYVMGTFDGGAGCLSKLPVVYNYGPAMFAGGVGRHNDLWNNRALVELSRFLLANGFIAAFEQVSNRINEDLKRFESGRGAFAPSMEAKVRSMLPTIAGYNGRVIIQSYLNT